MEEQVKSLDGFLSRGAFDTAPPVKRPGTKSIEQTPSVASTPTGSTFDLSRRCIQTRGR